MERITANDLNPGKVFEKLFGKFSKDDVKTAKRIGFSGLFGMLASYFYWMITGYSGPDAVIEGVYVYTAEEIARGSGRWMACYLNGFFSNLLIPSVIIFVYCLLVGISAYLICKMLKIRAAYLQVMLTLVMICSRTVIRQFSYLQMGVVYAFAFFMSVLAVYLIRKLKVIPAIIGVIAMTLMLGSYQSYIGSVATLAFILLIFDIFTGEKYKTAFLRFLFTAVGGALAAGLDIVCAKVDAKIHGVALFERVSEFSVSVIFKHLGFSLKYAYTALLSFLRLKTFSWDKMLMVIAVSLLVFTVLAAFKLFKEKEIARALIVVCSVFLLPLFLNVCVILFPTNGIYEVMQYHYVLVFALLAAMYEFLPLADMLANIVRWLSLAVTVLLICTLILSSNATAICYKLAYEATAEQATLMLSRVYALDGFVKDETKIVIADIISYQDTYDNYRVLFSHAVPDSGPVFWAGRYGTTTSRYLYFKKYLGIDPGRLSDAEFGAVVSSPEFEDMPLWPEAGSVRMINGYAVIKNSLAPPEY